jgi:hypothetical protein
MTKQFAPSFTAATLYRKTSTTGGTYFTGRMGGVKVALVKSAERADDGGEMWSLLSSEAAPYVPKDGAAPKRKTYVTGDPQRPLDSARRPAGKPAGKPAETPSEAQARQSATMNDPIPF